MGPHGIRQHEKGGITCLVIPVVAGESDLCGLQFITADGKKRFMRGTVKRAGYHLIGAAADETPSTVIIAEGYATAATLCEASGYAVAVAFDCGNLAPVAQAMSAPHTRPRARRFDVRAASPRVGPGG